MNLRYLLALCVLAAGLLASVSFADGGLGFFEPPCE